MYTIKCDDYMLYNILEPELIVSNPKVKLKVNTVGSASFTIHHNHPYYNALKPLKSMFEVSDEIGVIFRGRMTNNSLDFYNSKAVDLEGSMAFLNDSIVRPFTFPDDFLDNADYIAAEESGNVVEFLFNWLIDGHNSQVEEVQKFKVGKVTVADPNNYITRSNSKHDTTWNTLKSKLFDSGLGGYLCIRYEADGNYLDYVSEFELTNTQEITFGENLLDLDSEFDASNTFNAMIPVGADVESVDGVKTPLTITNLPDETLAGDIVKDGDVIYSISAVEEYGCKIFASPSESTWDDVTEAQSLLNKAVEKLTGEGRMMSNEIKIQAADLHFTDAEIRSFRIYRNVIVNSEPHNHSELYQLTELNLDLDKPQNTKISVGKTTLTMTDSANKNQANVNERIETVEKDIAENRNEITETKNTVFEQSTQILNNCESIILGALENYVETGNFDEYKETVKSQFELTAKSINMVFETTTKQITDVNGDMQQKFNQLYKHIQFTGEDGITISMGTGNMALQLDNDIISFTKDGRQFGWWDGVNFHTGNIVVDVNKKAQFGNFALTQRTDGSLSFIKVGG